MKKAAQSTQARLDAKYGTGWRRGPKTPAGAPAGQPVRVPGAAPARLPPELEALRDPIAAARASTTDCSGQAQALQEILTSMPGVERVGVNPGSFRTAAGQAGDHCWANVVYRGVRYVLDTSAAQYIRGSTFCTQAPLLEPSQVIGAGLGSAVETGVFTPAQHQTFLQLLARSRVVMR